MLLRGNIKIPLPYIVPGQQCKSPAIHSNVLCSSHEHQQKEERCDRCDICVLYPAHCSNSNQQWPIWAGTGQQAAFSALLDSICCNTPFDVSDKIKGNV